MHDRKTMPAPAADLMLAGEVIAGVFIVPRSMPLHQVIEDLELMITCSVISESGSSFALRKIAGY